MSLSAQQVARAYAAWVESGDDALAALSHEEALDHVSGTRGPGILAVVSRWLRETFAEPTVEIHAAARADDRVMLWLTISGVHVGNGFPRLAALPVRGRSVTWPQLHVFRLADDLIVEHWAVRDDLGLIEAIAAA